MHKYLTLIVAAMCLGIGLAGAVPTRDSDWQAQKKQLKVQQKRERNALKIQHKNVKQSWKGTKTSSATKAYSKHQMQRANRDLKTRQKDARQDMKDRHKALQEMQRTYRQ
jgi:uncharacterized protein HemX